jgi:hypothetical protein
MGRKILILWIGLVFPAGARADLTEHAGSVAPPVAGRPSYFDGAVGSGFKIQMRATPTQLLAEDPLILTVSITGTGNVQEIRRPDLRRQPRFSQRFHIDNLADRYVPAKNSRQFEYRLRPLTEAVKEIPPLLFVYFNPKLVPPEKGYLTTVAHAIPITVRPRAEVRPPPVEGMAPVSSVPNTFYELADGVVVLRHDPPFALPGPAALAAFLLGPPAAGFLWYLIWRRAYPDALRQAQKRRSRAAQHALKALQRSRRLDARSQAQQVETILAGYLRQRHDLLTAEPTPTEVARHLGQGGFSAALAQDVACFFSHCDAARFAPGVMDKQDQWTEKATRLVLALEEELWSSQRL